MRLTQHAMEKCQAYGVEASSLLKALQMGETFIDLARGGTMVRIFKFLDRPWVAVLNPDRERVITLYPTDQRTVESRRRNGRWMV
jgi:hypothetical protein